MMNDTHTDQKIYKTVREMLHLHNDISQFYDTGYSKEIIDGIFEIVKVTKIDKQVTMVLQRINKNNHLRHLIEYATRFIDDSLTSGELYAQLKTWHLSHSNNVKRNKYVIPLFDIDNSDDLNPFDKQYWWQCLECNHVFAAHIHTLYQNAEHITTCPFCGYKYKKCHSDQERELVRCLRHMFPDLQILNCNKMNRKIIAPQEVDIWIPQKKIAIEYNGVFWHSVEFIQQYIKRPDKLFHILQKTQLCEQKNVHLIHVYEDEWLHKQSQTLELLFKLISNDVHFDTTHDEIILSHDKYSSHMHIDGFILDHITLPQLCTRIGIKGSGYHVYDSGQLVFKRIK